MEKKKQKKKALSIREAERAICRNVQIERLPGNKTRLVSPR